MNFTVDRTIEILEGTPGTLEHLTKGLSSFWTTANEGDNAWSVFDVVGHLIHGDQTDWLARVKIILSDNIDKSFIPFDRFAQLETNQNKTLEELLENFRSIREENLAALKSLNITTVQLAKTGIHPTFGTVTLSQLLSTWAVHDLDHLAQIARIMAKQYKEETGPWIQYLKILKP